MKKTEMIENNLWATPKDIAFRTVNMAINIANMKKSVETLKSIMNENRDFNENEYEAFVDLFAIEDAEKLTQEEFNEFVKTDRLKINNSIVLAEREIKAETKRYVAVVADIQKNLPEVYAVLQEYTAQVLNSNK